MRCWVTAGLFLACLGSLSCSPATEGPPPVRGADITLEPDTATTTDVVPARATMGTLLRGLNVRSDLVQTAIDRTRTVWDPRKLRAGHHFEMVRTLDGRIRSFELELDIEHFLRVSATPGQEDSTITAAVLPYNIERAETAIRGAIDREASSLFAAMDRAGETADLTLALADVFSGEIDFNSDLQVGDAFSVVFERVLRDGQMVAYGPIRAAEFENGGRRLRAILFTSPGGKPGYYDEQGRSLRRFFLASPLKFVLHVTSRFSRSWLHPILRIYRPHLGVDYSAPQGTPVVAAASGTVVSSGWSGEGGRMVRLRHARGFETYYMHLSAIRVRAGERVGQGEVIGKVGMTGMATGPHLDYRIKNGNAFQDPQRILRNLPPGEPIPAGAMPRFVAERDRLLARLVLPKPAGIH
jgi:murein DD-endopeptidase MepM/ murein hydrolase activator NlpD